MRLFSVLTAIAVSALVSTAACADPTPGLAFRIRGHLDVNGNAGNFSTSNGSATAGYSGNANSGSSLKAKSFAGITTTTTVGDNTTTGTGQAIASTKIYGEDITGSTSSGTATISSASGTGLGVSASGDIGIKGFVALPLSTP